MNRKTLIGNVLRYREQLPKVKSPDWSTLLARDRFDFLRLFSELLVGVVAIVYGWLFGLPFLVILVLVFDVIEVVFGPEIENYAIYSLLHPQAALLVPIYFPLFLISFFLAYRAFQLWRMFSDWMATIAVLLCAVIVGFAIYQNFIPSHIAGHFDPNDHSPFGCIGFGGCQGRTETGWPMEVHIVLDNGDSRYGWEYVDPAGVMFNVAVVMLMLWLFIVGLSFLIWLGRFVRYSRFFQ